MAPEVVPPRADAGRSRACFMTSERLGFGTWTTDDDALATAIWGDPEVTRLSGGPFTPVQVRTRLEAEISNLLHHGIQYWPLFRRDTGAPVGCCGLQPRDPAAGVLELGYHLRREAWGQGYATEAGRAVIAWAAARGVPALFAGHHPQNHASGRTLRKLGFTYTHDEHYPPTGLLEPCYLLRLTDEGG
ncbi:GNAT family N-acetyltransferase [Phenylobacterium sp.]|uniref:GNAT family N-acetyltransferase n=1 Tax=Phenylobacterium sp. TaxID=1871053 RepID=UPI0025F14DFC|nr:GNAT family N-acetyltransferase [Phenylobacterium sp.]